MQTIRDAAPRPTNVTPLADGDGNPVIVFDYGPIERSALS